MDVIYTIHSIFGEMVLPVLIVLAAIALTVMWKPNGATGPITRIFPILVDIQATLGILWLVIRVVAGDGARLLSFPFLLHPILGLLAAGVAHMAVAPRGPFARFGRWSALIGLVVLLVLVLAGVIIASQSA